MIFIQLIDIIHLIVTNAADMDNVIRDIYIFILC